MGKRGLDLGTGFPLRGFSQTITVLDEEIDEGGWEPSLHHKGSAVFGGLVEVSNQPGDTSYFDFLPRKRHGKKPKKKLGFFFFGFSCGS